MSQHHLLLRQVLVFMIVSVRLVWAACVIAVLVLVKALCCVLRIRSVMVVLLVSLVVTPMVSSVLLVLLHQRLLLVRIVTIVLTRKVWAVFVIVVRVMV